MTENGYDTETAVGVTAASSTIGVIIPPSIPMVIYGGITNASIASLFLAGIIPGLLVGLAMMFMVYIISIKKGFPKYKATPIKQILKLFVDAFPALLTPVIIIGGIITGWYTPTEAAAFASLYSFFIGMFVYRTIKWRDIPDIFEETMKLSSLSLFALAGASAFGELLGYHQVGLMVQDFFAVYITQRWLFTLIVIVFFLFCGYVYGFHSCYASIYSSHTTNSNKFRDRACPSWTDNGHHISYRSHYPTLWVMPAYCINHRRSHH